MAGKAQAGTVALRLFLFTVTHVLNPMILANRRELPAYLFQAVRDTVPAFAADPQWRLQGKPGLLTILHTWSQTLIDHFHIHCLIPAGVLSFKGRRRLKSMDKFLFHVTPLAKEMKKRYLALVEANADNLNLPEDYAARLQERRPGKRSGSSCEKAFRRSGADAELSWQIYAPDRHLQSPDQGLRRPQGSLQLQGPQRQNRTRRWCCRPWSSSDVFYPMCCRSVS